jgi:hypothetical protein
VEAKEFFLVGHALAHAGKIVDVDGYDSSFYEDRVVNGLSEDQLRRRPQGLNSIAFLLWHIARTEDVAANVVIAGQPQVFDEGTWAPRLHVARRDLGFGSTSEQVQEIGAAVDLANLRAYRLAVGRRTRALVQSLPVTAWEMVVGQDRIDQAIREGAVLPQWLWPREKWAMQRVARLLSWPCLGHSTMHLGQAMWVRKLVLEHPSSN